jgi:hypothetical protein
VVAGWKRTINQIALQEMIHLALVNNLLAALGGAPRLGRHNLPQRSPYAPEIQLTLAPFGEQTLQRWWRGREVIASFAVEPRHRYLPTQANGQAANAAYRWDAQMGSYVAEALEVLTLEGARVKEMTAFMMPAVFPRFGLPEKLPGADPAAQA